MYWMPIAPNLTRCTKENDPMKHYLLTGATGVVGSAVFRRLIKSGQRVTLLVRADSETHLTERFKELLAYCELPDQPRSRVCPIKADLYQPGFALAPDQYRMLLCRVTHILHCAGNVTMGLPEEIARKQTMAMTKNIVSLMERSRHVKKMEYVSTVGVAGYTPNGICEKWITDDLRVFRNSYEAAKACAETYLREKIKQGLNITVHRPSMVVGDSTTGKNIHFQVFYYLCEFLSGSATLGFLPDLGGMYLDVVPSDYVADLIYWASCQDQDLPRVLHASAGPAGSIDLNQLSERVRKLYLKNGRILPKSKRIPIPLYLLCVALIKWGASKQARKSLNTLPFFLAYLKMPQHFINTRTRRIAAAGGIALPEIDGYLEPVLQYYLEKKKNKRLLTAKRP